MKATQARSAPASATFRSADTTTQGTWKGVYGADGYNIIGDLASYPLYASVSPSGQSSYTWSASTADVRGLEKADAAPPIGSRPAVTTVRRLRSM